MGHFRVEVNAIGGHGCQRHIKSGEKLQNFCGLTSCPDCIAREFIRDLKRAGVNFEFTYSDPPVKGSAILTHWPGTTGEVKDNLLTGDRTGSF